MAAVCYNKNLTEYRVLKNIYGDDLIVDALIQSYQESTGTDEYPTPDDIAVMLDGGTYTKNMDGVRAKLFKMAGDESLNPAQRDTVQQIAKFHLETEFEEESHTYTSLSGDVLNSTTTLIKGAMDDAQNQFAVNRRIGNAFDRMLQAYLEGKDPSTVSFMFKENGKDVELKVSDEFKQQMSDFIEQVAADLMEEGSVLIPQVVVSSPENKIAGSIDILVIKPNGDLEVLDLKASKNSVKLAKYDTPYTLKGSEVDEETGEITYQGSALVDKEVNGPGAPVKLSTRQQHSMQVGIYARMLMNRGFSVTRTATYHIKYDLNTEGDSISGFESEGYTEHSPETDMQTFAEAILPLNEEMLEEADVSSQLSREMGEEGRGELDDEGPEINSFELAVLLKEEIIKPLSQRLNDLQDLYDRRVNLTDPRRNMFVPKAHETIDALADLIYMIEKEGKTGKALLAYGRYLNHAAEEIQAFIDYMANDKNLDREVTAGVLENFAKFIQTYETIQARTGQIDALLPTGQRKLLDKLKIKIDQGKETYHAGRITWLTRMVQKTTSEVLTEDEVREQLESAEDISWSDAKFGDISTSTDIILRVIDKLYKRQSIQAADESRRFSEQVDDVVEDLVRLSGGKVDYSFMYEEVNGEPQIISKYGLKYETRLQELKSKLYDSEGNYLQYREIKDSTTASKEDIEWNKRLFSDKKEYSDFLKAENIKDGKVVEGDHHRYAESFRNERAKFEVFNGRRWVKRIDVSDYAYRRYRSKYYNVLSDIIVPIKTKDGKTSGATKRITIEVVDRKYVEPRETAADGTSYLNEKFEKLMNPTTDMGAAQKKFYEFYVNSWENGRLSTLPAEYSDYLKGKIPVLKDQIEHFANLPVPLRVVAKWLTSLKDFLFDWSLPIPEVKRARIDENGNIVSSIPLFIQGLRGNKAQEKIDKITEELKSLKDQLLNKKISHEEYKRKRTDLKDEKKRLEKMPSKVDPDVDIARALKVQNAQIDMYSKMTAIEDVFNVIKHQALERQYYSRKQYKASGEEQKEIMDSASSKTIKRMEKWFKMTYNKQNYFDNMTGYQRLFEVGAKKLLQGSSLLYVGLNPWANASNYIWGRVSTGMETAGGLYYKRSAMIKAVGLYQSDYTVGRIASIADGLTPELKMKTTRSHSKYEALAKDFNMARQMLAGEDRAETEFLGAYLLQDAAEFNVQSKTGIAMLLSTQVISPDGTEMNLYDAYDFDNRTGRLIAPEGDWKIIKTDQNGDKKEVAWDENEKAFLQNKIYEVNKQMHGNYSAEDRAAIQDSTVGSLGMQFHKWVYPAWKAHFKRRYFDENLGYYEGRFNSLVNFVKAVKDYGSWSEAVQATDELAKSNMRKVAAELGIFATTLMIGTVLASLRKGLDDDDEETKSEVKRILNQLSFLNDRLGGEATFFFNIGEQITLVSNPFASSRYVAGITEALTKSFQLAFYSVVESPEDILENKDVYYQRGSNKGKLKAAKEWKDILPALYALNRWEAFNTVSKDYRANK